MRRIDDDSAGRLLGIVVDQLFFQIWRQFLRRTGFRLIVRRQRCHRRRPGRRRSRRRRSACSPGHCRSDSARRAHRGLGVKLMTCLRAGIRENIAGGTRLHRGRILAVARKRPRSARDRHIAVIVRHIAGRRETIVIPVCAGKRRGPVIGLGRRTIRLGLSRNGRKCGQRGTCQQEEAETSDHSIFTCQTVRARPNFQEYARQPKYPPNPALNCPGMKAHSRQDWGYLSNVIPP